MKNFSIVLVSVLALGACGGDDGGKGGGSSGVSGSVLLKDLTPSQSTQLCHYAADQFPERTVTCSGQMVTIGINDAEDCTDADPLEVPDTCTATVADAENCFEALGNLSDNDICTLTQEPAACAKFDADECDDSGSGSGSAVAPRPGEPGRAAYLRAKLARY